MGMILVMWIKPSLLTHERKQKLKQKKKRMKTKEKKKRPRGQVILTFLFLVPVVFKI